MTKVQQIIADFDGMWDEATIKAIRNELEETQSEYLLPYEIYDYKPPQYKTYFIFIKTLQQKAKLKLKITYNEKFMTLKDFMDKYRGYLDVRVKTQIMASIWNAFKIVTSSITQLRYHIKLLSLHPSNILIQFTINNNYLKITKVQFAKYLPEIFYENITTKKEMREIEYPQDVMEEILYISPRYLNMDPNIVFDHKKGLFIGSDKIDFKDSYYSLGALFAYIALDYDLVLNKGLKEILRVYKLNETIKPNEFELHNTIDQFIKILMSLKTSNEDIEANEYIKTLNLSLGDDPINAKDLQFISKVGSGATGTLYKCLYTKSNGEKEMVAAKQLEIKDQGVSKNQVFIEYEMLSLCRGSNFVNVRGLLYSKNSINPDITIPGDYYYILMELADEGSLDSYISKRWHHGMVPKQFIEHVFIEMLCGLWFLHSRCIVHRDIKPLNVLVISNKQHPDFPYIRICDLGQAKIILTEDEAPKTWTGTSPYMSPEFQHPGERYTYKIDLWSFAITVYEIITFRLANGKSQKPIVNCQYKIDMLFNEAVWKELPELKDILQHLFVYDYEDRWGWPELFRNNYVQSLLFKRQKRMLQEQRPGQNIEDIEVRKLVEEDNAKRTYLYKKLFKFGYK